MTERPAIEVIRPQWAAPAHVQALSTTRAGGVSRGHYASLNLATHVGDEPDAIARNRAHLKNALNLPGEPCWLTQTHGTVLIEARRYPTPPEADACFCVRPGQVCAILTADCLPILLCDRRGETLLAVHAGWRGLLENIITKALDALPIARRDWLAWIGPGIGVEAYTVGTELVARFCAQDAGNSACFVHGNDSIKANLPALAERQLQRAGVTAVSRYEGCTAAESARFFSYRRQGITGRMATLIWRQ